MQDTNYTDAAVLVPIYRDSNGELKLILIKRSDYGIHAGQLAFPGGKTEPCDNSLFETALRETEEEIGLIKDNVKYLTDLPVIKTMTTKYRIYPFLGKITPMKTWNIQKEEVSEIIEVNVNDLVGDDLHATGMFKLEDWDEPREISYYIVGTYQLWGATYRIVRDLLPRLLKNEFNI